jgi:Xaa-Pro dipeptidase
MKDLTSFQEAIRGENLDGWLFCNFHHRDALADRLLGLSSESMNTRFWFYFIPASGEPRKVTHAIEGSALASLPGSERPYSSRAELLQILKTMPHGRYGCSISETIPVISFIDDGTASMLRSCGFELVSAASLIQRKIGILDFAGIASHEDAAKKLRLIVENVWKRVRAVYRSRGQTSEGEVQRWILEYFEEYGLESDETPIVGAGIHSSDPHYEPKNGGEAFSPGDVIQLDLWAKNKAAASVYADISWVGIYGESPAEPVRKAFEVLTGARDHAVAYIADRFSRQNPPSGREVDDETRRFLTERGYGGYLKHRTGHGIDVECHGSGVNLDGIEFPDDRSLLEGSCFSVEPGIYFPNFGLRTEIDVYIRSGRPVISGGNPQRYLLTCKSDTE